VFFDLLVISSDRVFIMRRVDIARIVFNAAVDDIGANDFDFPAFAKERVEVFKLLRGVIVTDRIDLAEVQLQESVATEVFVDSSKPFPLHEEGLKGRD
jgi:hypothetical protein